MTSSHDHLLLTAVKTPKTKGTSRGQNFKARRSVLFDFGLGLACMAYLESPPNEPLQNLKLVKM